MLLASSKLNIALLGVVYLKKCLAQNYPVKLLTSRHSFEGNTIYVMYCKIYPYVSVMINTPYQDVGYFCSGAKYVMISSHRFVL